MIHEHPTRHDAPLPGPVDLGLRLIDWTRQLDELAAEIRDYCGVSVKSTDEPAREFSVRLDRRDPEPSYYYHDEPSGTCAAHGNYWTDDCIRCGR